MDRFGAVGGGGGTCVSEEYDPSTESDLRRRAAWLLGMLVVVAGLVVLIMVTVLGGSGDSNDDTVADPTTPATSTSPEQTSSAARSTALSAAPSSPETTTKTSTSASTSASASGRTSCPDAKPCILDGDVGGAVKAINDYRTQHGLKAVPGTVGKGAQKCALNNGSGCSGGWAETQVAKPDGAAAVQKIQQLGKLLDPNMKSIEVGWAYDPGAKQYYFALIRQG